MLVPSLSERYDTSIDAREESVVQTEEMDIIVGILKSFTLHVVKEIVIQDVATLE